MAGACRHRQRSRVPRQRSACPSAAPSAPPVCHAQSCRRSGRPTRKPQPRPLLRMLCSAQQPVRVHTCARWRCRCERARWHVATSEAAMLQAAMLQAASCNLACWELQRCKAVPSAPLPAVFAAASSALSRPCTAWLTSELTDARARSRWRSRCLSTSMSGCTRCAIHAHRSRCARTLVALTRRRPVEQMQHAA